MILFIHKIKIIFIFLSCILLIFHKTSLLRFIHANIASNTICDTFIIIFSTYQIRSGKRFLIKIIIRTINYMFISHHDIHVIAFRMNSNKKIQRTIRHLNFIHFIITCYRIISSNPSLVISRSINLSINRMRNRCSTATSRQCFYLRLKIRLR